MGTLVKFPPHDTWVVCPTLYRTLSQVKKGGTALLPQMGVRIQVERAVPENRIALFLGTKFVGLVEIEERAKAVLWN